MKKFAKIIMPLAMVFSLCSCDLMSLLTEESTDQTSSRAKVGEASAFVSVDINPSIKFAIDSNGLVVGLFSDNDEGSYVAYALDDLRGLSIEDAIAKLAEACCDLGYLNANNSTINITGSNLTEDIYNRISAKACVNVYGFNVDLTKEQIFSVAKEYLEYLDENDIEESSLSYETFELAYSLLELTGARLEGSLELSEEDLIKLIGAEVKEEDVYITDEYRKQVREAMLAEEYARIIEEGSAAISALVGNINEEYILGLVDTFADQISSFTFDNAQTLFDSASATLKELQTVAYKYGYQIADTIYELVDLTYDMVDEIVDEYVYGYELTENKVSEMLTSVGLQNTITPSALANSQGKINLESIEKYFDKFFKKNHTPSRRVEKQIYQFMYQVEDLYFEQYDSITFNNLFALIKDELTSFNSTLAELKGFVNLGKDQIDSFTNELSGFRILDKVYAYFNSANTILSNTTEIIGDFLQYANDPEASNYRLTIDEIDDLCADVKGVVDMFKKELKKTQSDLDSIIKIAKKSVETQVKAQQEALKQAKKQKQQQIINNDPKFAQAKNKVKNNKK